MRNYPTLLCHEWWCPCAGWAVHCCRGSTWSLYFLISQTRYRAQYFVCYYMVLIHSLPYSKMSCVVFLHFFLVCWAFASISLFRFFVRCCVFDTVNCWSRCIAGNFSIGCSIDISAAVFAKYHTHKLYTYRFGILLTLRASINFTYTYCIKVSFVYSTSFKWYAVLLFIITLHDFGDLCMYVSVPVGSDWFGAWCKVP